MSFFHFIRFLLFISQSIFFPIFAMENTLEPSFFITNNYGKDIHIRFTFEYLDDRTSCADLEESIRIVPGEILPIILQKLTLIDAETKKITNLAELDLTWVTIEAWVPGWEVNRDLEPIQKVSLNPEMGTATQVTNEWGIALEYGQKLIMDGWNFVRQRWKVPDEECLTSHDECDMKERVQFADDEEWHDPERCAAHISLVYAKSLQIAIDPIRDSPLICFLGTLPNSTQKKK